MNELKQHSVESSELVDQTFKFWFNDNEHIRSPFPKYIHSQLRFEATDLFFNWAKNIDPKAKEELNDEIIGEKFEEFIFETATKLIKTEDERITILYPFLPILGDKLQKEEKMDSEIVDRSITKEGDTSYLKLKLENIETKDEWETQVELPL